MSGENLNPVLLLVAQHAEKILNLEIDYLAFLYALLS